MTENPTIDPGKRAGPVVRSEYADADGDETRDPVPPSGHADSAHRERSGTDESDGRTRRSGFEEVDTAYREWARNRSDLARLRRLRDVVVDCLGDAPPPR